MSWWTEEMYLGWNRRHSLEYPKAKVPLGACWWAAIKALSSREDEIQFIGLGFHWGPGIHPPSPFFFSNFFLSD